LTYDEIQDGLAVGAGGTSLADIRLFLEKNGLDCIVIKTDPAHIGDQRLPLIAHWEEEKDRSGHYVVVTAVGKDWVEYIDGTTAAISVLTLADFSKRWTGYAMIVAPRAMLWTWIGALCVLDALAMFVALLVRWKKRELAPV
jgi:ABC-type bacteriocin/lantibiotic exporter with double-glycine peptidase domain